MTRDRAIAIISNVVLRGGSVMYLGRDNADIKAMTDAVKEHMLLIGLDKNTGVKNDACNGELLIYSNNTTGEERSRFVGWSDPAHVHAYFGVIFADANVAGTEWAKNIRAQHLMRGPS